MGSWLPWMFLSVVELPKGAHSTLAVRRNGRSSEETWEETSAEGNSLGTHAGLDSSPVDTLVELAVVVGRHQRSDRGRSVGDKY